MEKLVNFMAPREMIESNDGRGGDITTLLLGNLFRDDVCD